MISAIFVSGCSRYKKTLTVFSVSGRTSGDCSAISRRLVCS